MKLKSFRFRIALLSALLSGIAVVGFCVVTYVLFYQSKLATIDREITDNLLREASEPRPNIHWQLYEKNRGLFFGDSHTDSIALLVLDINNQVIYQSQNWQTEFQAQALFSAVPPSDAKLTSVAQNSKQETNFSIANLASLNEDPIKFNLTSDQLLNQKLSLLTLHDQELLQQTFNNFSGDTTDLQILQKLIENELLAQPPFLDRPPPHMQQPPRDREDTDIRPLPPRQSPHNLSSLVTRKTATGQWRMGTVTTPFVKIALAINLQVINREMSTIQGVFLIAVPFTLCLVMVGAWWLSADALKPIRNITGTIRRVNAKGLNQRASIANTDLEFIELVQVFNQMMERLERSFLQASRFSADAAHELKTPLAILQGELELALHQTETGSKMQQTLSNLLDEVSRLSSITRKLLLLSLADAGRMNLQKTLVNLSEILQELAEDIDILAPEITLKLIIGDELKIMADRELIIQILQNLITNAIKYNVANGWIQMQAKNMGHMIYVTISNSSQDIALHDRERIFDRFHRADPSRNRGVEGFGLGLSLSREIARAHQGNLQLDPPLPNCTSFTLTLPLL